MRALFKQWFSTWWQHTGTWLKCDGPSGHHVEALGLALLCWAGTNDCEKAPTLPGSESPPRHRGLWLHRYRLRHLSWGGGWGYNHYLLSGAMAGEQVCVFASSSLMQNTCKWGKRCCGIICGPQHPWAGASLDTACVSKSRFGAGFRAISHTVGSQCRGLLYAYDPPLIETNYENRFLVLLGGYFELLLQGQRGRGHNLQEYRYLYISSLPFKAWKDL